MTVPTGELVPRRQLLEELGLSDSSERRKRQGDQDWPPHLYIGTRIYYRRSAVDDYLRRQEAICQTRRTGGIDDETMRAVLQRAKDLVEDAPELTPQQILLLRSIFANRAGATGYDDFSLLVRQSGVRRSQSTGSGVG